MECMRFLFSTIVVFSFVISNGFTSEWKKNFKDFKPSVPAWLSSGKKPETSENHSHPKKPYQYWKEQYQRNSDIELQKIIQGKLTEDEKRMRSKPNSEARTYPWRCKIYYCR